MGWYHEFTVRINVLPRGDVNHMSDATVNQHMSLHNIQRVHYELDDAEMNELRAAWGAYGRCGSEDIAIKELFRAGSIRTYTDCMSSLINCLNETGLVNIPLGWKFPNAKRDFGIYQGTRVYKTQLKVGESSVYYIATAEQYVYRVEATGHYVVEYDDIMAIA